MKTILLFILVLAFIAAEAQSPSDTVGYFNEFWLAVKRKDAHFYRTVEPVGKEFHVRDCYMSGQLQMEAICQGVDQAQTQAAEREVR